MKNKDPLILFLIGAGLLVLFLIKRRGVTKQCNPCQSASTLPGDIIYTVQPRARNTGLLPSNGVQELQPRVLYKNTEELTMVRDPETQRIEKVIRKITVTENE